MNIIKNYQKFLSFENALLVLLLLYPLFSTVVRHWNSTLFGFIVLTSLVYFFSRKNRGIVALHKYEKMFLWFLAGNFFIFLLTSLNNLPEDIREIRFDIELRFLLIIPVYLLLRSSQNGFKYLAIGAACSVFVASLYALNDVALHDKDSFEGVYSRLYTGPINLIYMCIAVSFLYWNTDLKPAIRWFLLIAIVMAGTFTIIYTYSRVTYFSYALIAILFAIFMTKNWWRVGAVVLLVGIMLLSAYVLPQINSRMSQAYAELTEYIEFSSTDERITAEIHTSVGTRLEMWRSVPLVLRDHTLLGVGNGNYNKAMQIYIDVKELNPVVNRHSHAHNVFVNVLIVKGLFGLAVACLVLFYPLYIYLRTYKQSSYSAAIGIIFTTIIILYSINETAPFVKSNFVATFLLISVVIFQNHIQRIKELNND